LLVDIEFEKCHGAPAHERFSHGGRKHFAL